MEKTTEIEVKATESIEAQYDEAFKNAIQSGFVTKMFLRLCKTQ